MPPGNNRPGPLLVLSDLMDDGWLDGLRELALRGFEVSLVHILSPDEADPQLEGDLKLLDAEGGPPVEITADYDLLARYRQNLASLAGRSARLQPAAGHALHPTGYHPAPGPAAVRLDAPAGGAAMNFLAPVALALGLLLPVIVAFYLLKLRRTEHQISSTYLWRKMIRDVEANAPWQKLKPNLLLFLQLLFLSA